MRRGIGATAVVLARTDRGFGAGAPFQWRGVVLPPDQPRETGAEADPWGADEPGVSPFVAGLACGAAVVVVALAGWLAS